MVYDRYGNRTQQNVTAGTGVPSSCLAIEVTTNHVTGTCGSSTGFSNDANGNMTGDGTNTIAYDAENHAVSSSGSLGSGTYTYDGHGLRVKKVSGSTTIVSIFSGAQVIAEYVNGAAPSAPTNEYIYAGGRKIVAIQSGSTYYLHNDHLSLRVRTNTSGAIADQRGHYPFGETWYSPSGAPLIFTNYYRDTESGNDYALARTDITRFARFSSPDPLAGSISNPQSLNRYAYVRNNPTNAVDPSGKRGCFVLARWKELSWGDCGGGGSLSDGAILSGFTMGNDIFDALAGAPGTYTRTDIRGNLSFGFSIDLYVGTLNLVDRIFDEHPNSGLMYPHDGFQVDIIDLGATSISSGLLFDLANGVKTEQLGVSLLPNSYKELYDQLVSFGMSPEDANAIVFQKVIIDVQDPNADPKVMEAAGFIAAGSEQFQSALDRLLELFGGP